MKNVFNFGTLSNSAKRCGRQAASILTLQDITIFHLMNVVEQAKKLPVFHDTIPAQQLKLDGTNIYPKFKLIPSYTPEYIITGCKGTTTSIIRNGMHGITANSTKRCGATSSPKPKQYTTNDTTASTRFEWVLSLCNSPKGGLQGDRTSSSSLQPTHSLWQVTQDFYKVN